MRQIVPKLLNFEQKQRHMDIFLFFYLFIWRLWNVLKAEYGISYNEDPDLLKKVITGDKSWVYGYNIEIKAQILFYYDWGDKRIIETEAIGDTKKSVSSIGKTREDVNCNARPGSPGTSTNNEYIEENDFG